MSSKSEKRDRVLELPEIISGMLVLFVVLWEACFEPLANGQVAKDFFINGTNLILTGLVGFNTLSVFIHFIAEACRKRMPGRFLWWQLLIGIAASLVFYGEICNSLPRNIYHISLALCFMIGVFSLVNILALLRVRRSTPLHQRKRESSPAGLFFISMVVFVIVSTLILLTPGATREPVSLVDALFTCASAVSITGLTTLDVGHTFTTWGQLVILANIQVGAVGVMTFSYFVLLLVGKNLVMRDRTTFSSLLDQQGVNVVPALIKAVIFTTVIVEAIGAVVLWAQWKGDPLIPQQNLVFCSIFHSVSAFCNAGITLFPNNMATAGLAHSYGVQGVMMILTALGTLGFSVYLEALTRLGRRLRGQRNPVRWSTSTWLNVRAMVVIVIIGSVIMALLGIFEPSARHSGAAANFWEALWNTTGRSAGFNIADISDCGPAYQLFICFQMFVGGNPAGTGGGVFAPVFALCTLEVLRVLRSEHDVVIHGRRIHRSVVERAMSTVVLAGGWIALMFLLLVLLEPTFATQGKGLLQLFFVEVSAFTTAGYSICDVAELSSASKILLCLNMLFGRVGLFTFMLIFIRKRDPAPYRFPETRLPLS